MDRYTPPFLGRRRGWLLTTQVLLLLAIAAMGFLEPVTQLRWMAALAVVIAFCSASQDIVFDAWKPTCCQQKSVAPARDQRAGLSPGDAGLRWTSPVACRPLSRLAGDVLADGGAAGTLYYRHAAGARTERRYPGSQIARAGGSRTAARFFGRNNAWLILLLIVLYKLGDAFAMSLTTTFLIRGVGFDAGEVGMVNKTLGLFATILGALYGGVLMQRLTLFRALLIFGLLQGVSNAGYWLLSITDKHLYSMATAVFFENLCGGMGTAAFVALLMTLCNKSFSATQFALLSALSAVGRVYVGPIAGWFVEAHGWSTFYLFSVVAAVPGIALLLLCRQTLEHTQRTASFMPRSEFPQAYALALGILTLGCLLLAVWLALLILNALDYTSFSFLSGLLEVAALTAVGGILFGGLLDYLALRKTRLI